jgi:hypothetical protein
MASNFETVRPGDVITADLINRIIQKLLELEQKVGTGGTTTQPVITSLDPPTEQIVGQKLTINGNFDTPLNVNTVKVDNVTINPIDFLVGSGPTKIIFNIPESIVVAAGAKKSVDIVVQTSTKGFGLKINYLLAPIPVGEIPNPNPVSIKDLTNPSLALNQVVIGHEARISGTNLGANAVVTFITVDAQGEHRITAAVQSGSSTQINLLVPTVPGAQFDTVAASVEVAIPGALATKSIPNVFVSM